MKRLIVIISSFIVVVCLTSCNGSSKGNSENLSNAESISIDEDNQQYKKWDYNQLEGNYTASLLSENYYITKRGENLYGKITIINNGVSDGSFLSFSARGGSKNIPQSIMTFPHTENYFRVSFNDETLMSWPALASQSGETFIVGNFSDWLYNIKKSDNCTIFITTDEGELEYSFNCKGLNW